MIRMLVHIDRPCKNGTKYTLKPADGIFVMINLDGSGNLPDNDLQNIVDLEVVLVDYPKLEIYYPAYQQYFCLEYRNELGFTLQKILQCINKTGYEFHYFDYKDNPTYYNATDSDDAASSVGEYSVESFYIDQNKIYVEINH